MIKKYGLLFAFLLLFIGNNPILAQQYDDKSPAPTDTTIVIDSYKFRVQAIDGEKYMKLYKKHRIRPSTPITDIKEVVRVLSPEFEIKYSSYIDPEYEMYGIYQIEKKGSHRILLEEVEGFEGYFPKERILCYLGGHQSGQSVNIDTGEPSYDPLLSAVSKDGKYIFHSHYNGQDGLDAILQKYDKKSNKYQRIADLTYDIFSKASVYTYSLHHEYQFWVNDTLYIAYPIGWDEPKTYSYWSISISE